MKNKLFKFLVLSIFAFIISPVMAQPPCTTCPPAPASPPNMGGIAERNITNNNSFTWTTENNSGCDLGLLYFFHVNEYETEGGAKIGDGFTIDISANFAPFKVYANTSESRTNLQLITFWANNANINPAPNWGGSFFTIDAVGVYLVIGTATQWLNINPSSSGTKISTGQPFPCDCIQYFFEPIMSGMTVVGYKLRFENATC